MADPISAGIAGIAQLGGAALGGKGAKQAAKAQERATDKALAFQKEESRLKREADERRWAAWNAGREALMKRYGIDIAPPNMPGAPGAGPGGPGMGAPGGPPPAMAGARPQPGPGPGNIRELMTAGGPAELGEWSDWARYGLGGPRGA